MSISIDDDDDDDGVIEGVFYANIVNNIELGFVYGKM